MRSIEFHGDHFTSFYSKLDDQTQEKIDFRLEILESQQVLNTKVVKHITNSNGIYELIIPTTSNREYRVLFFCQEGSLSGGARNIVLLNGFLKKSNKDYAKNVRIAESLKAEYYRNIDDD